MALLRSPLSQGILWVGGRSRALIPYRRRNQAVRSGREGKLNLAAPSPPQFSCIRESMESLFAFAQLLGWRHMELLKTFHFTFASVKVPFLLFQIQRAIGRGSLIYFSLINRKVVLLIARTPND